MHSLEDVNRKVATILPGLADRDTKIVEFILHGSHGWWYANSRMRLLELIEAKRESGE